LLHIANNLTASVARRLVSGTMMGAPLPMITVSTVLAIEDQAQHPAADEGRTQPYT
jgi:hypothetical protein